MDPLSLDKFPNIPSAFLAMSTTCPKEVVYGYPIVRIGDSRQREPRVWKTRNYSEVRARIERIARYLLSVGVKPGDRIAILSNTRPEWMEADLAILMVGGIVVSIYQSLPSDEAGYILFDSGAEVVFAENEEQLQKLLDLASRSVKISATEDRPACEARLTIKNIITFEPTDSSDRAIYLSDLPEIAGELEILPQLSTNRDDLASLVYTSGTTGPPKGVMQTHGNHLSNVRQAFQSGLFHDDSSLMLFLPLAHSFARLMAYIGFLTPATVQFVGVSDSRSSRANPESLAKDLREANATIIPVVPRLLEKMQGGILGKASKPGLRSRLLSIALWSVGGDQSNPLRRLCRKLTTPVRKAVAIQLFGLKFQYCVSGGAKLAVPTAQFFDALEINVLEGYGLTETCVATNINRQHSKKIGTVGPVMAPDIELQIGDDGEILYRGPNIAKGYYKRPTATKASWSVDGWFHTGDLGSLDSDGFLSIVGRKKELIVTSNGKKIPPERIEQMLKGIPFVSQAVLIGDDRPYCVAIVTLNGETVQAWARERGLSLVGVDLLTSPEARDLVWKQIQVINQSLASFETIKNVGVVPEEFTVENGILTPTFKVKRREVSSRYRDLIGTLYSERLSE